MKANKHIEWWDSAQTAEYLGISLRSLSDMVRRGEGPVPVRITSTVQYEAGSVREWVEARIEQARGEHEARAKQWCGIDNRTVK